jgi:hypothetical protein
MCLVGVYLAPFALRMSGILEPLRGWTAPVRKSRWQVWVDAIESIVHVEIWSVPKVSMLRRSDCLSRDTKHGCGS